VQPVQSDLLLLPGPLANIHAGAQSWKPRTAASHCGGARRSLGSMAAKIRLGWILRLPAEAGILMAADREQSGDALARSPSMNSTLKPVNVWRPSESGSRGNNVESRRGNNYSAGWAQPFLLSALLCSFAACWLARRTGSRMRPRRQLDVMPC